MTIVGVSEYAHRPYGKLSGGQRKRCDIARAFIMSVRDIRPLTGILDNLKHRYTAVDSQISVKIDDTLEALPILEKCRPFIEGFEVTNGTMDEAFIELTGKELRQ